MKTIHLLPVVLVAVSLIGHDASSAPAAGAGSSLEAPGGEAQILDLSRFYGEKFVKDGKTNGYFKTLIGRQVFDGLPFQVEGLACLYGRNQARGSEEGSYPDITGIPVGRKFEELHLLHQARWADVEGETIAVVRLDYNDGTKHEFPIRYGTHVRDWQRLRAEEKELVTDPNSKIVWRGEGFGSTKTTRRLFKSMLANPSPEKVVATIDIQSTRRLAAYELAAATVAMRDPNRVMTPPPPAGEPERLFDGAVIVHVLDGASGQPIAKALVQPGMNVDETYVVASPLYTSTKGEAIVRYPSERTTALSMSVEKEGYGSGHGAANLDSGTTNQLEIELRGAPKLTGMVRRPDGEPAASLEVRVVGSYNQEGEIPKTDAEGKFTARLPSEQFGGSERSYAILIRDAERNLAVAQDIDEETGPLDLRLAPGLTLAGRAEVNGKPITNATAALVFWTANSGMHLQGLAVRTNDPGRFEIPALPPGRRYGVFVSAPGYGQKYINAVESGEDAKRIELDPVELKPANLKLAGQVLDADDKPVKGANVFIHGEGQPSGQATTDGQGRFNVNHVCEGSVNVQVSGRNGYANIAAEGGDTNVVVKLGESPNYSSGASARKLKGVVTGPDGQPVAGAQVAVFPDPSHRSKTGTNGAFSLTWTIQPWQLQQGGDPLLVVRDAAHHLAAAEAIPEDTTNLNVQLKPALTVTGRVEGPDGVALANAQVGLWVQAGRSFSDINESPAQTDAQGRFELKTLPVGPDYTIYATAKDHGRHQEQIEADSSTNRIELPPLVLNVADKTIAGQVLNAQEKPVSGVNVSLAGEDQPQGYATTDSKGRFSFKVCEGQVQLFANASSSFGSATAEAGDTNVVLQLGNNGVTSRPVARRASLKGKPLPDLAVFGLAADAAPTGKPLLVCLLDAEQRPSRRSVHSLTEQQPTLAQKGVAVLAIQAALADADTWQAWTNSTPLPFPLGRVAENTPATKWATGVESLPWFILRDAKGNVVAEGFTLEELDAKLEALERQK